MKLPRLARVTTMLTLRAPSWPRRKTSPSAAKENRSESDDPKSNSAPAVSPPPPVEPEPVPNGRFGANRRLRKRRSGSLSPMKADGTARPASSEDLEAEALRRESLTGSEAVLDASHEEYVRREELVAAAREVGWEPFSCEEIRAVTLN